MCVRELEIAYVCACGRIGKKERGRQKESDMEGDRIKYDEWKSLFGVS